MNPRSWTGDGGGIIYFVEGYPSAFVTPSPPAGKPLPDFEKGIPDKWDSGPVDAWGHYSGEIAVRDEGSRGLPIDHVNQQHAAFGISDHKEGIERRLLEKLHDGDAAYFEGLAQALRRYKARKGNPIPDTTAKDRQILETIASLTTELDQPPSLPAVYERIGAGWGKQDDFKKHLKRLGFEWLPRRGTGRPRNSGK